jgi:2-dehydro-3-deoxygluconokinase
MNIRKKDIIVLGECFVEYALAKKNQLHLLGIGGDCLAVACAAARLGSKVDLISAIGLDTFGDTIRNECARENVDVSHALSVDGYNGIYAVEENDPELREFVFYRPGNAALSVNSKMIQEEHIKSARIVHASSITQSISPDARKSVFKAFELSHLHGGMISYDPNLRLRLWPLDSAKEAIWSVLPFIDVIFASAPDESKVLFGLERPVDIIGFLWDHGINVVVVKNGAEGCVVGYDGKVEEIPAVPVKNPVHYTCVGSAFCGGFLHGIASGLDPFKAARIAVFAASYKLEHAGSIHGLPKAKDLGPLLSENSRRGRKVKSTGVAEVYPTTYPTTRRLLLPST